MHYTPARFSVAKDRTALLPSSAAASLTRSRPRPLPAPLPSSFETRPPLLCALQPHALSRVPAVAHPRALRLPHAMAFSSSSTSNNVALAQGNQQVPPIEMPPTIELTPKEDALCALLDDTCAWIARERPELVGDGSGKCECRIAGGWVRDKVSRPIVPVRSLSQQPTEPPPPPRGGPLVASSSRAVPTI